MGTDMNRISAIKAGRKTAKSEASMLPVGLSRCEWSQRSHSRFFGTADHKKLVWPGVGALQHPATRGRATRVPAAKDESAGIGRSRVVRATTLAIGRLFDFELIEFSPCRGWVLRIQAGLAQFVTVQSDAARD